MIWETLAAHPSAWSACAIGSDLFTATMPAHVLLKPRRRGACPLPISVKFRMVRSSHQLMNRQRTIQSSNQLLRRNPAVPDELPCQTPVEYNKCWAASNCTFCKIKVPKSQERIHLGDSQNKREHSSLPSLGDPRVFNRGQRMAKVVVIVNCMTITKMPVKGAGVPEPANHLNPTFRPLAKSLLARIVRRQRSTRRHHPHHIVRLLHPPKIVCHAIHCARNCMVVPDIHPIRIKELLHRVPRYASWPIPPFFD